MAPGRVSRACLPVSRSLCDAVTLAPGSCLLLVSLSFCGQRPDAVTPAPGSSPACLPASASLCGQMPGHLSPCVSQFECDAGSGVVSPEARCCDVSLCLALSAMLTLALGSWVLSPACLSVSGCQLLRRWLWRRVSRLSLVCDAGSGVVSVSPTLLGSDARCCDDCGQMPDAVTPAPKSLVSLSLPVSSVPDAVTLSPCPVSPGLSLVSCVSHRPLVSLCLPVSAVGCQLL